MAKKNKPAEVEKPVVQTEPTAVQNNENLRKAELVKQLVDEGHMSEGASGFLTKDDLIVIKEANAKLDLAKDEYAAAVALLDSAEEKSARAKEKHDLLTEGGA